MSDRERFLRRRFLAVAGSAGFLTVAGCTSDEPTPDASTDDDTNETTPPAEPTTDDDASDNGEIDAESHDTDKEEETDAEEPVDQGITFDELYEGAERKRIIGSTASQTAGSITASDIESMLSPNNTEAENVAIAATHASKHTREREDVPYTIRHILDELGLDAYAQKRATLGAIKTDIYVEDGNSVKKVAATKTPHNARNPIQYTLIGGEEPTTGDGAVADNNLQRNWNEDSTGSLSYIDFRAIKNADEKDVQIVWDGVANQVKRSYLLDMGVEGSDIDFTLEAGTYMADLEDIDNSDHTEAFEAYKDANEFYHEEVVPEDQHLLVELDGGELQPIAVDEETLMEEGYLHSHI
ncbi:hypothetical protein ACLI4U_13525 [Natrialbaceae archaeon A-CW2]